MVAARPVHRHAVWFEGQDPPTWPITVADVATGVQREVGNVSDNGFAGWGWSPNGRAIVSTDESRSVDVVDAQTAQAQSGGWQSSSAATWQRIAP